MRTAKFTIGTAPAEEACAQTGVTEDWLALQQLECVTYRAALIAVPGPLPVGLAMPVMTCGHDFGSYAELEVRFDPTDPLAAAYAVSVEDGLASWMEGGFTAPVEYDERGQERVGSRRLANDCVVAALVGARRLAAGGYATERETRAIANLTVAFPNCAAVAEDLLAALAVPAGDGR
jgi:hypothetical protein